MSGQQAAGRLWLHPVDAAAPVCPSGFSFSFVLSWLYFFRPQDKG